MKFRSDAGGISGVWVSHFSGGTIQKRGLCKSTPKNSPPPPTTGKEDGKKGEKEERRRAREEEKEGRKGKNFGNDGGRGEKRTF